MYLLSIFPLAHEDSVRVTSICVEQPEGARFPPTVVSKSVLAEAFASLGLFKEKRLLDSYDHSGMPLQFSASGQTVADLFFCLQFGVHGLPGDDATAGDRRYALQ